MINQVPLFYCNIHNNQLGPIVSMQQPPKKKKVKKNALHGVTFSRVSMYVLCCDMISFTSHLTLLICCKTNSYETHCRDTMLQTGFRTSPAIFTVWKIQQVKCRLLIITTICLLQTSNCWWNLAESKPIILHLICVEKCWMMIMVSFNLLYSNEVRISHYYYYLIPLSLKLSQRRQICKPTQT